MLLKNCDAYINGKFIHTDILIEHGKIAAIAPRLSAAGVREIDCANKLVCAGFIDIHEHLREPGFSDKETIACATTAAAKGGITTVCAMPNLRPVPDSLENLAPQLELIKQHARIKVLPYAAITKAQQSKELSNMAELSSYVFAFSDDGCGVTSAALMQEAMQQAKKLDKFIISHCEERELVQNGVMHKSARSKELNLAGISSASESIQVARDGLLALEVGAKFHICHISAKESVAMLKTLKNLGAQISAEVTPHHLISCVDDIPSDDGAWKMNPPLREQADRQALINALNDGLIEVIATDHAPHTKEQKQGSFNNAYFGIIGSEFAFSLLYTKLVLTGLVKLERILDAFSSAPKRIFNLTNSGALAVGEAADIAIIDLEKEFVLKESDLLSKGKNTPYLGERLRSKVVMTIVDGEIIYKEDE